MSYVALGKVTSSALSSVTKVPKKRSGPQQTRGAGRITLPMPYRSAAPAPVAPAAPAPAAPARPSPEERLAAIFAQLGTPTAFQLLILEKLPQYMGMGGDAEEVYVVSVLKVVHSKEALGAIHRELAENYDQIPADPEALALLQSMQASVPGIADGSSEAGASESKKFPMGLALAGAAALAFFLLKKK